MLYTLDAHLLIYTDNTRSLTKVFPLAEPQLKDLVLIRTVKWYNLGLQLGVEDAELKPIQHNYPRDSEACTREMFRAWLRTGSSPSYQQLVEALRAVGENREANRLCERYGKIREAKV